MRQELLFALEKMRVLSVLLLLTDEDLQKSFLSLMRDGYIPKAFKDLFDPEYGESLESFFGDAFESHVLQFLTKSLEFFKSCLFYDEKKEENYDMKELSYFLKDTAYEALMAFDVEEIEICYAFLNDELGV